MTRGGGEPWSLRGDVSDVDKYLYSSNSLLKPLYTQQSCVALHSTRFWSILPFTYKFPAVPDANIAPVED